ncbi:MAG: hypothetical protein R3C56_08310 [Pirellulaceae bacterium]
MLTDGLKLCNNEVDSLVFFFDRGGNQGNECIGRDFQLRAKTITFPRFELLRIDKVWNHRPTVLPDTSFYRRLLMPGSTVLEELYLCQEFAWLIRSVIEDGARFQQAYLYGSLHQNRDLRILQM